MVYNKLYIKAHASNQHIYLKKYFCTSTFYIKEIRGTFEFVQYIEGWLQARGLLTHLLFESCEYQSLNIGKNSNINRIFSFFFDIILM